MKHKLCWALVITMLNIVLADKRIICVLHGTRENRDIVIVLFLPITE